MKPLVLICSRDYEFYLFLASLAAMRGFDVALYEEAHDALAGVAGSALVALVPDNTSKPLDLGKCVSEFKATPNCGSTPIVVFIGAGNERLYIEALKAQTDEIFMRPFDPARFLAYLDRLVPPSSSSQQQTMNAQPIAGALHYARIAMIPDRRRVEVDGKELHLSPIEFRLLRHLLERPEVVFSRDELIQAVWPNMQFVEPRTVDVHVGRLRRALTDVIGRNVIRTVRAAGYSLDYGRDGI